MAHPLLLFIVAKKIGLYALGRAYGFRRLYRRALEANRRLNGSNLERRAILQKQIRLVFTLPSDAMKYLESSEAKELVNEIVREGMRKGKAIPSTVLEALRRMTKS
eukprot:TRINITY_DN936_c0_g1::TRINITY_DN936_c0_g1_i1::g.16051::m.16051 TRINITY_DN936_c0_g1::TRINITY_DN936_c0_g1_i1::g.16051  ORF type:complete len:106 (-),score=-1.01,Complex1_LYR/PF05347.10/1.6,Complex1_LYR/PF05347.10/2e+02,tRNA-synt_2c/PF01411.14/0.14 TRINITY_DN936_c0_g1_i1:78-395(-)